MMKAWQCNAFGPLEDLELVTRPSPTPDCKQVHVRVRSIPLGFMDTLMIRGLYQLKPPLPYTPGAVGAGDVLTVGSEVDGIQPGDRVSFLNYYGAMAEEICTDAHTIVVLPDGMDYETGACYRLSYTPAYLALAWRAHLQPGETLLVTGASGGVGHAAVRLGKQMGARVIGSVGSDDKIESVYEFGADAVVNHASGRLRDQVKDLTDGRGADVILDVVGGDVFDECIRCVNMLGRIIVMGFTSGRIPTLPTNLVLLKNCSIIGVFLGGWMTRDIPGFQRLNQEMLALAAGGKLPAHVSRRFSLDEAVTAMNTLLGRGTVGKIVLEL